MNDIYISRFASWAPDSSNLYASPDISFTDPMFRRRLSQISKMTIQVVHDILPIENETKIVFTSFRGEVSRQYSINKMVIEDNDVKPAAFSLSVFNAPAALASMALGLKGGYSAIYPGNNSFATGLIAAQAALLTGSNDELVFVYADEAIPQEYSGIVTDCPSPLAFALLLKRKNESGSIPLSLVYKEKETVTPEAFLGNLLSSKQKQ